MMTKEPLHNLTLASFHEGLLAKRFSALEMTQAHFDRIEAHNPEINAYLSVARNEAERQAEAVDVAVARDEAVGPLAGAPLAIKDCILVKGLPATAASKILEEYVASYDAGVIGRLKDEQAVFLGKTNLDEFAMGGSTENSAFGPTKNPRDLTRVAGGSSGGSVAAVAAHLAVAALGTDTGGSIRLPSSFCGTVGMSPTYGAVSRSGVIAMASSLDQVGPITKTVEDAAVLFNAIRGHDPLDATSAATAYDERELLSPDFKKTKQLVIGLPKEYFTDGMEPEVRLEVAKSVERLKALGFSFKEISLPHTKYALSVYYIIVPAEVSSNLARFDGIRYAAPAKAVHADNLTDLYFKNRGAGFGAEAKRRIILGTFVLSSGYYDAYYEKAQRVRALIRREFEDAFKGVDVMLTPVAPMRAFKIGARADDPLSMYLADVLAIPAKLGGFPAISIPTKPAAELAPDELPVGFQLIGRKWREADILGIGRLYEK
ncbi:MAG TPA: Asp-tRNA(Asn)/Glu-tRNA(Gln) amidotransferase subunit GatA [Candidatus Paceibacterota bacterium]|nr:Asp-tRNA(Asn)/Glu-tRNA(Gln) amidotransferase subunit GatA [Candidatus Paceibacterota bacterium]